MSLSRFILVALLLVGCNSSAPSPTAIVPGERVGPYVLGTSTLRDIMGEDSPDARKRFAEQGLLFEFEQGRELKAVTVTSDRFETSQGLKVGSTVNQVENAMGKPTLDQIEGEKIEMDSLGYPGVTFIPKDGRITAIRVGGRAGG